MKTENQAAEPVDKSVEAGNNDALVNELRAEKERMQAKLDELLAETKKAKESKRQAEEEAKAAAEEKAKSENDYKQLYESAQARIREMEEREAKAAELSKRQKIESEAIRIASSLTKDTAKADLLAKEIKSRLSVDAEGFKVLDESGNLTISSIDELVSSVKERYAFLVDANGSTGGSATGANSGAVKTSNKKFNEYTGAELSEMRKTDPGAYEQLKSDYYGAR